MKKNAFQNCLYHVAMNISFLHGRIHIALALQQHSLPCLVRDGGRAARQGAVPRRARPSGEGRRGWRAGSCTPTWTSRWTGASERAPSTCAPAPAPAPTGSSQGAPCSRQCGPPRAPRADSESFSFIFLEIIFVFDSPGAALLRCSAVPRYSEEPICCCVRSQFMVEQWEHGGPIRWLPNYRKLHEQQG